MTVSILGRRYAQALFSLAEEAGTTAKVKRDLHDFRGSWDESKELRSVFENPSVSMQARSDVLRDIAVQCGMNEQVRNTLLLMSDRGRLSFLPEVADSFDELAEARSGKVRAEIVSAEELPESYLGELTRTLKEVTGKDVTVVRTTDPSLIGGVVAKIGDQVYDGSLRNRLSELRDELLK